MNTNIQIFQYELSNPRLSIQFQKTVNIDLNGWYSGKDTIVETNKEVVKVVNNNKEYEINKYIFITCSGRFEVMANGFQVITEN